MDNETTLNNLSKIDKTCVEQKWNELFPNEPYEITDYAKVELDIKYEPKSEYNLVAAAERQREFYYNVSLPHYAYVGHNKFLTRAIVRWV